MPFIDRRGKLFGRWHVIDVLAGGAAFGLICSGYVAAQIISGNWRSLPMRRASFPIEVQATFVGLDPNVARQIRAGDVEMDTAGRQIARILEVGAPVPETVTVRYGDHDWVKEVSNPASGRVDVPVRMWIASDLRGDTVYFKQRPVGSGTRIGFAAPQYHVQAIVYDEAWMNILVQTAPLSLDDVQRLQSAQEKVEMDLDQRPIARLLRIEWLKPVDPSGRSEHLWVARAWVAVRCTFVRGVLKFKGNPVVRNQGLFFQFAGMKFSATVFEINALDPSALRVELNRD